MEFASSITESMARGCARKDRSIVRSLARRSIGRACLVPASLRALRRAAISAALAAAAALASPQAALADGFISTGSCGGRYGAASAVLPNGNVLIAGGINGTNTATALIYDVNAHTFGGTSNNLSVARGFANAVKLQSGKILVVGGGNYDETGAVAAADVYDPATGKFTATAHPMHDARDGSTATLLPNGKVLIAGGIGTNNPTRLASAELYDPATNDFTVTGSMHAARDVAVAVLLNTGKVLIAGGGDGSGFSLTSAELYDPAAGTFANTGSMHAGRDDATATLLPNGKVLVAAGINNDIVIDTAEIYDPTAGTFAYSAATLPAQHFATATMLPSNLVLIAGGVASPTNANTLKSAVLYDYTHDTFTATGSMSEARYDHTANLLGDGTVLVACGYNDGGVVSGAELYGGAMPDEIFISGFDAP